MSVLARGLWCALLAGLAGLAAGCGSDPSATASPSPPEAEARKPREVQVVAAAETLIPRTVVATGTLAADDQVILSMKVAGRISELAVDLGSPVRAGQVVARLDPTDFRLRLEQVQAALQQARVRLGLPPDGLDDRVNPEHTAVVRQARAVLDEARLTRERMERLWEQELIARAQLDAAVSALQLAEGRYQDALDEVQTRQAVLLQRRSEVALARQALADAVLISPIDGAVRERRTAVGQYVDAGTPVLTVVRIHPLRLRVSVPEREAAAIAVGQPVRLSVEGDQAMYAGRVVRLSPVIEEQNRSLLLEAEVPNERGRLRPGSFAKAEIEAARGEPAIVVPASSIVTFAGIEKVLTVAGDRAVEKRVVTGRRLDGRVEVSQGLEPGDLVVIQPGNLVGGQPVTVRAAGGPADATRVAPRAGGAGSEGARVAPRAGGAGSEGARVAPRAGGEGSEGARVAPRAGGEGSEGARVAPRAGGEGSEGAPRPLRSH